MTEKKIKEIKLQHLNTRKFIAEKIKEIATVVGNGTAINALSGGVDSSAVTVLGYRALGERLLTYFIDNGLMREGEPEYVVGLFKKMGIKVILLDARKEFFGKLKGLTDPEEKREAITQAFYKDVFGKLVKESGARFLLHGTNYTDVEETVAGVKRQHNILDQLGIDTQKIYGYKVSEPLVQLRKPAVRVVAKALGLPKEIYSRPPFPGPALAARVIGEVTPERIKIVKHATKIVEEELRRTKAFQYLAILHADMVTGVRSGKRDFGSQIELRCWDSKDAVTAKVTRLPYPVLEKIAKRMTTEVPGVVSVTYNITTKPPSTIEAI
ncbi:MAG: ExsB family transcriptional regulator [Candidatus Fischerbacteria bacterium RBG_13_37_8]|uniref:GMP synthase (glutamine-hydrolyzing) n=1 Tax=Candidatus Fischerbacteria bacterium RBG_13_37_8 TaxID=1817863 RepID=A0A1F5VXH3_9BACT|nr:MAG: ExsB family transcriptional regulator [Candidatus Fischerbacteria bacterium RBG_13_37_8]